MSCFDAGIPVVSGTTGWLDRYNDVVSVCKSKNCMFFYASNFSLGVNIFFKVNRYLARMMNNFTDYCVDMTETHHVQKLDAPSGTAISLAKDIIREMDRVNDWKLDDKQTEGILGIEAIRRDKVPGIHTIHYESEVDDIEITHHAKNRKGFVLGAVLAAEFCNDQEPGIYNMDDLLKI
jgi:4-hydroxy-tetrahydrodipicolinate reductase